MAAYIDRAVKGLFLNKLIANKVLLLTGARRVGKTLFLKNLINNHFNEPLLFLNGEEVSTTSVLAERTVEN